MSDDRPNTLDGTLQRIQAAIDEGQRRHLELLERWARSTGVYPDGREWRRGERLLRRQARRQRRRAASPAEGVIYLIAAAFMGFVALRIPHYWWLVFIALGLGLSGLKRMIRSSPEAAPDPQSERDPDSGPLTTGARAGEAAPSDKKPTEIDRSLARLDQWCERLLAEVKRGPEVLRDVVRKPEETVQAIKQGCHALAKREAELRGLLPPEDDARLTEERERLAKRLEAERDEVTRQRLSAALVALDEQRKQRAELLTAASRMEAERTRLSYVLESLYTQVLRVRSADTASAEVAGQGLKQSLERLGEEVGALADALESVNRDQEGIAPVSLPSDEESQAPGKSRERV